MPWVFFHLLKGAAKNRAFFNGAMRAFLSGTLSLE